MGKQQSTSPPSKRRPQYINFGCLVHLQNVLDDMGAGAHSTAVDLACGAVRADPYEAWRKTEARALLRCALCAVCCAALCAVLCCAALCCAALCCAALRCVLCCAVLCCAVLRCAALRCAALRCAALCAVLC